GAPGNLGIKSDSGALAIRIEENSGVEGWHIGVNADGDLNFDDSNTGIKITFQDETGRVGIGAVDPSKALELRTGVPVIRLRDTGDTTTATTAFVEFGGTTASNWDRTGYIGDGSSGDTHIRVRAEDSDLYLGDSSGEQVLILSDGDATFSGDVDITGDITGDQMALNGNTIVAGTSLNIAPLLSTIAAGANNYIGVDLRPLVSHSAAGKSDTGLFLAVFAADHGNNVTNLVGVEAGIAHFNYTGTIANAQGISISAAFATAGGTVTDYRALEILNATNTGTFGTQYGIYIEDMTTATTDWAIFSLGGNSAHAGNLRLGDTTAPTVGTLEVNGSINFAEVSTPTALPNFGALYTKSDNALYFQDGAGTEHIVHGDAFSNLWFHDVVVSTITISAADTFVAVTSFDDLGEEDDLGNLIGSTSTNDMTVGANGAGEYKATFHLSAGSGGAADEFIVVLGQVLATPITITAATTATPIVCTAVGHGMRKGDMVTISGGTGMTAINGDWFLKPVTADTFTLLDLQGANSVGSGTYDGSSADVDIIYHGNILLHRKLAQGQLGTGGANADLRLSVSDKLKLYVANIGGTDDIDFTIVNMEAKRIGD
ncbi:hypothetical protein LCGC14_1801780, partial [marine sediment metagenome]